MYHYIIKKDRPSPIIVPYCNLVINCAVFSNGDAPDHSCNSMINEQTLPNMFCFNNQARHSWTKNVQEIFPVPNPVIEKIPEFGKKAQKVYQPDWGYVILLKYLQPSDYISSDQLSPGMQKINNQMRKASYKIQEDKKINDKNFHL